MELPADSVIGADDGHPIVSLHVVVLLCSDPASSFGHQPGAGSMFTFPRVPASGPRRPVQRGRGSLFDQHQRIPGQPGNGHEAVPLVPNAVDLTISGITQIGYLTLTVPAGAFTDELWRPQPAVLRHIWRRHRVPAISRALTQVPPAGSLIYDPAGLRRPWSTPARPTPTR